jgi:hypothetical protein
MPGQVVSEHHPFLIYSILPEPFALNPFILLLPYTTLDRFICFETKSDLFCLAFKTLQNLLALLSFPVRSVSFLSLKKYFCHASVCTRIQTCWVDSSWEGSSLPDTSWIVALIFTCSGYWSSICDSLKTLASGPLTCFPLLYVALSNSCVSAFFILHSRQSNSHLLWVTIASYTYYCHSPYCTIL